MFLSYARKQFTISDSSDEMEVYSLLSAVICQFHSENCEMSSQSEVFSYLPLRERDKILFPFLSSTNLETGDTISALLPGVTGLFLHQL